MLQGKKIKPLEFKRLMIYNLFMLVAKRGKRRSNQPSERGRRAMIKIIVRVVILTVIILLILTETAA